MAEGFAEYVKSRADQKLFDGTCDNNTNRVNLFIHGLGIDKTFYAWRHRVLHSLDKLIKAGLTTESLNRFIAGHAGSNIAQKHYPHHDLPEEFPEIVRAINGITRPGRQ